MAVAELGSQNMKLAENATQAHSLAKKRLFKSCICMRCISSRRAAPDHLTLINTNPIMIIALAIADPRSVPKYLGK